MTIVHDLDLKALAGWATAQLPSALFWTVSGSHLYGFSSIDSDVDLRGCFQASIRDLVGLKSPIETLESKGQFGGRELEAVSHEVGKYLRLLCRHNGYILEQIFSPLVISGVEFLDRLRPLASRCVTRNCYHHYRGFVQTQRKLMEKEAELRAKSLLYAYRVVMTGVHMLQTGMVESHLPTLNNSFRAAYIPELIERKREAETGTLRGIDREFHMKEIDRWERRLEEAHDTSRLQDEIPRDDVDEFLIELRLGRDK
jgi:predicted nucleotidyltransferase